MQYCGPDAADLANVRALNRAFLNLASGKSRPGASRCPEHVSARLAALDATDIERLANCPFLLVSLNEDDERLWQRLFAAEPQADLLDALVAPDADTERLIAAALGFLWQLAKQNPFAARLVSGATLQWCEQLAASTFLDILDLARQQRGLLSLRRASDRYFWDKLLGPGTSAELEVRGAAHICALQTLLTQDCESQYRRLPAAACGMPVPAMRTEGGTS